MHVMLLFPPNWTPTMPHLALPTLAAFLRGHGIRVTQRDLNIEVFETILTRRYIERMLERLRGAPAEHARYLLVSGRTAVDVMTAPVITIAADATPAEAIRLMQQHRVKRLPVLDAQGRLVGLIGRAGVLRALSEAT